MHYKRYRTKNTAEIGLNLGLYRHNEFSIK